MTAGKKISPRPEASAAGAVDLGPLEQLGRELAVALREQRVTELLEQIRVQLAAQNQLIGIQTVALVRLAQLTEHEARIRYPGAAACKDPHGLASRLNSGLEQLAAIQDLSKKGEASDNANAPDRTGPG